ncbi:MAG TPA: S8 family serine peptidase [Solirubrobacteraceae bacterium]|nr:S8 family serine peptidase [Solirubrobacteraceae bacterium]
MLVLAAALVTGAAAPEQTRAAVSKTPSAAAPDYVPGQVVVGYKSGTTAKVARNLTTRMGVRQAGPAPSSGEQVVSVPAGVTVEQEASRLRAQPGVAYAVPNYIAHVAGGPWIPNDPGPKGRTAGAWQKVQWNFLAGSGVNAPDAWANLRARHRPGGTGVTVAILDTGVAYRNWNGFRKAPDFTNTKFVHPYDFVAHNPFPLDREGHGTFVAGIVGESTNNHVGLAGIAYGASIMPVRVLDADGTGDAATISKGIRYAADHGAQIINLSLEFDMTVNSGDIPDILSAIRYAHRHGALVVAASGNEGVEQIAYPARAPDVVAVGATTKDRCLADYSNGGSRLALVAPGGGEDSDLTDDPDCHPTRNLPNIVQMTFRDPNAPDSFGYPRDWYGTSMAAPHVAAVAALVIASGVIGRKPSPDRVLKRLEQTAVTLGGSKPNHDYGNGLVDAGAATSPLVKARRD